MRGIISLAGHGDDALEVGVAVVLWRREWGIFLATRSIFFSFLFFSLTSSRCLFLPGSVSRILIIILEFGISSNMLELWILTTEVHIIAA